MRRFLTGSAVLFATAWAIPASVHAATTAPPPAPTKPAEDEDIVLDEAEGDTPAKPAEGEKPAAGGDAGASVGGDLFADEKPKGGAPPPGEGGKVSKDSEVQQLKDDKAFISVVQRQRFLKKKRFEHPARTSGITVNDPFVRHYVVGAELNYWLTNRIAVGLTGYGLHRQQDLALPQHPRARGPAAHRQQDPLVRPAPTCSTTPSTARSRSSTAP
jgi:hypothetical protein